MYAQVFQLHIESLSLLTGRIEYHHTCCEHEYNLTHQEKKQEEIISLKELHRVRVADFRNIKMLINMSVRLGTDEARAAALSLIPLLRQYEKQNSNSYATTTRLLSNLLEELHKERWRRTIELLQLESYLLMLGEHNEAFEMHFTHRSMGRQAVKERGTLPEARRETDLAFLKLVETLNAYITIEKEKNDNAALIKQLNEVSLQLTTLTDNSTHKYRKRMNAKKQNGDSSSEGAS
ncbi:DUF6261 family protein [Parabacteroides sp. OttesenSCG-928-N08]|nr:DUF6261 family protein [Parabacteroides sp. OttesenSCG-928-N08]